MSRHFSAITLCFVATSSIALAEPVAVTGTTTGTVLVNHGNGYVQVSRGTPLAPGDIVSVRRGGQVVLDYENGCSKTVKAGRVETINRADCICEGSAAVGSILVDHGKGFVRAFPGTALAPGDIVSVRRPDQVVFQYTNGCRQTVKAGPTGADARVDCVCKARTAAGAANTPLIGGLAIAGAGIGAAVALGLAQDNGAPGGGRNRHFNPISR